MFSRDYSVPNKRGRRRYVPYGAGCSAKSRQRKLLKNWELATVAEASSCMAKKQFENQIETTFLLAKLGRELKEKTGPPPDDLPDKMKQLLKAMERPKKD